MEPAVREERRCSATGSEDAGSLQKMEKGRTNSPLVTSEGIQPRIYSYTNYSAKLPVVQETWVQFLDPEDPLEKE